MLPEMANIDLFQQLPRLEVPVFLFQGRHDYAAPATLAERYYQGLLAPRGKHLIWFEESAHMPHYEEPGKFREAMLMVKESLDDAGAVS